MDVDVALQLHRVVWLMDRKADELLRREYGVSLSWGRLLIMLSRSAPLTQHELAQRLEHSDAAISRQLERMSASGLLTVTTDPTHRRKRLVSLTAHGRIMVAEASAALEDLLGDDLVRAGLDTELFASNLTALAEQLSGHHPPGDEPRDPAKAVHGRALQS